MQVMEEVTKVTMWVSFCFGEGVLTLAAAAIVGTGLKSWWSTYGLVWRGVTWSHLEYVTERYRKKRSNRLRGPIMHLGRKPGTNQQDAHVLGIPQSSGHCSRMMVAIWFPHTRQKLSEEFDAFLMHLHEEFSRSISSIRTFGAAWQATVREVFGRSVARKCFEQISELVRWRYFQVTVRKWPLAKGFVLSRRREREGEGERAGEGRRTKTDKDGRLTVLFVIAIAVFSRGCTSSTGAWDNPWSTHRSCRIIANAEAQWFWSSGGPFSMEKTPGAKAPAAWLQSWTCAYSGAMIPM